MDYLPVGLKLAHRSAVLVGGGQVALRKARLLLAAGANLTVVAPRIEPQLEALLRERGGVWQQGVYTGTDITDAALVVAATPDPAVNEQVSRDAKALRVPVNVVDAPALCTFVFPAIVERGPLTVAISSGGRSPVLVRELRRRIEILLPAAYGRLAEFAGRFRERVRVDRADPAARRRFWERVFEGSVAELVLAGSEELAGERLLQALAGDDHAISGEVCLVGAGPGDPDLLTLKALRMLQRADVILYDRLVAPAILDRGRRDARRIYVGKARSEHSLPQGEINQLLVDLARQGLRVVRLKGGDPFIFGRGGEEIALLARNRIPFQVVPGITAANGAACYAGIPLTHRDHAQSVRFIAGHLKDGTLDHDWRQFLSETETLVFYMGLVGLPMICEQLQRHGRAPETPIALVERASTPEQRVHIGTLATMPGIVARERPRAPTLILVGSVVSLHADLAWFEPERVGAGESGAVSPAN